MYAMSEGLCIEHLKRVGQIVIEVRTELVKREREDGI